MSELPIRKFLDISTAHVSPDAGVKWLDIWASPIEYGWLLYAGSSDDDGIIHEAPAEIQKIAELARDNGCDYIMFDRDVEAIDELPQFDWEKLR